MDTEDLHATLERVGERFDLGEYEREAYLTVLEHGRLTASEIADRTAVPQPRVYDTVRSLSDRGLVELRESRPMTVVAIDPTEAFDGIQSSLEGLVETLEDRYTAPARGAEAATLVKSRSTIVRYLVEVVESAEYELSLALTPRLLDRLRSELAAAVDDGVSVTLIVSPAADAPDPDEFDYGAVATVARGRRGLTTPVVAVADGVYSVYTTQDALSSDRDRYGVIFNRSALGFLVSGFFGTVLWTTAERSLHTPESDRPFPRRYASIRRCARELHDDEGELYATITGRDVVTGESRRVEGRVTDVVFEAGERVAALTVETDDGPVTVGGRVAALEDVEAHEIRVDRDSPPGTE